MSRAGEISITVRTTDFPESTGVILDLQQCCLSGVIIVVY